MRWPSFMLKIRGKNVAGVAGGEGPDEVTAPHLALGRRGEGWAAEYLERIGYQLVAANFTLPVGRNLRGAMVNA